MKRTPIRPVSRKRAAQNRVRARLRLEMVGKHCEAQLEGCAYTGTDWHERLSRARGGSITATENRVWLCRPCHQWITEHPKAATELGFLASAYGGTERRFPWQPKREAEDACVNCDGVGRVFTWLSEFSAHITDCELCQGSGLALDIGGES